MSRVAVLLGAGLVLAIAVGGVVAPFVGRPPATPVVDTAEPEASIPPRATIEELYAGFDVPTTAGTSFGETVLLSAEPAGEVVLPSGRLVASDAMIVDGLPFTTTVEPGRYPVSILLADLDGPDERVAAAMVHLAPADPVRWELALVEGQDPSVLGPDEVFGYGVDSGSGAFTSPEAVEWLADPDRYEAYSDAVFAEMFPEDGSIVLVAETEVDPDSGANVVAFASGFGDGSYPTFVGYDVDDEPVVVVTDFGVLDAAG
jgi:hypothetical protein